MHPADESQGGGNTHDRSSPAPPSARNARGRVKAKVPGPIRSLITVRPCRPLHAFRVGGMCTERHIERFGAPSSVADDVPHPASTGDSQGPGTAGVRAVAAPAEGPPGDSASRGRPRFAQPARGYPRERSRTNMGTGTRSGAAQGRSRCPSRPRTSRSGHTRRATPPELACLVIGSVNGMPATRHPRRRHPSGELHNIRETS